ncbi:hypothetical protein L6452_21559 [Arctium lappa]|uniref:Uncharacterized protein n=1 Tax=Arctium lappa TaxID=4217 RepID=A0ACB9AWR9_ARCLA|nr:hypothetical protein L6452_21559 [Arctium lappa]
MILGTQLTKACKQCCHDVDEGESYGDSNDVIVDPDGGGGTVVEDGRNDEEERDVSVGENSNDVRVDNREVDNGDL